MQNEEKKSPYKKDFDAWNTRKKHLNAEKIPSGFFFLEREIWWASLGVNIGREIDGKNEHFERPVLVLRKFSSEALWILPISKTLKKGEYFHTTMHNKTPRTISLLQLRLISTQRLLRLISKMEEQEFEVIKNKIINLLRKSDSPRSL